MQIFIGIEYLSVRLQGTSSQSHLNGLCAKELRSNAISCNQLEPSGLWFGGAFPKLALSPVLLGLLPSFSQQFYPMINGKVQQKCSWVQPTAQTPHFAGVREWLLLAILFLDHQFFLSQLAIGRGKGTLKPVFPCLQPFLPIHLIYAIVSSNIS